MSCISKYFFFAGIASLPIAECAAIFYIAPLLITFMSSVFLKEPVGQRRFLALIIGFIGVLLIVKPGQISFQWETLLPICAAFSYAGLHTMTRHLGLSEKASTLSIYIQFSFIIVSLSMGLIFGTGNYSGFQNPSIEFLVRAWVWPERTDLIIIIGIGVASSFGGYLISQAYRNSHATLIAPFEYTGLVLAVIWGIIFWQDWPNLLSGTGIFLILTSGIYVALREVIIGAPPSAKRSSGRR